MKVFLTGSSGRIGGAIAALLATRHELVGMDLRPGPRTTVLGDVAARGDLQALLDGCDAVVHTASLHAPHVGMVDDAEFRRVNVSGTRALLEAAVRAGVRRFVYTSTTSVYGDAMCVPGEAAWVSESLAPRPRDIYDETKLEAERACAEAAAQGLACTALRMSRCFPEREDLVATYRLYRGVDARDVAQAHALALSAPLRGFGAYNISAPSPFRRDDAAALAHDAAAVIGRHFPWAAAAYARRGWRLPARVDRVYVIDAAREALGYRPRHDFASLFGAEERAWPRDRAD